MKNKLVTFYSIFVGVSVISMWVFILCSQSIPEGKIELSFHLFSEFLMAIMCIISGFLLIKRNKLGKLLNSIALGMVLYSVLNAAGYYGQKCELPMFIMFLLLFIATSFALTIALISYTKNE
jgi:hypothetical protein